MARTQEPTTTDTEIKAKQSNIIPELTTFRFTKAKPKVKFRVKYLCGHEGERSSVPISINTKAKAKSYFGGISFTLVSVSKVFENYLSNHTGHLLHRILAGIHLWNQGASNLIERAHLGHHNYLNILWEAHVHSHKNYTKKLCVLSVICVIRSVLFKSFGKQTATKLRFLKPFTSSTHGPSKTSLFRGR